MILDVLASHKSVEAAAKDLAGNWSRWQHFVWFGANDIFRSDNVALGYITNNIDATWEKDAHLRIVKMKFKDSWGSLDTHEIDSFGSSFCGDSNALTGIMVRVYYNDGEITNTFRELYQLAHKIINHPTDEQDLAVRRVFEEELYKHLRWLVQVYLPGICEDRGITCTDKLQEDVLAIYAEDYEECDEKHIIESIVEDLTENV